MTWVRHEAHCLYRPRSGQGLGGGVRGPDGLPGSERKEGTIACQETGGRAQAYGAVRRGARAIWRKPDCLNPSLQKAQIDARRKDACNRAGPFGKVPSTRRNPPGRRSDALRGIEGDERDA